MSLRTSDLAQAAQAFRARQMPSQDPVEIPHLLVNNLSLRGYASKGCSAAPRLDLQHGSADLIASGTSPALTVTNDKGPALAVQGSIRVGTFEYRFPDHFCGELQGALLVVDSVQVLDDRTVLHMAFRNVDIDFQTAS